MFEETQSSKRQEDVRAGIVSSIEGLVASLILGFQIIIVAAAAGLHEEFWWILGGTFVGLTFLTLIPYIRMVVGISLAAGVGFVVYSFASMFDETAGIVIGTLAFMVTAGINITGVKHG